MALDAPIKEGGSCKLDQRDEFDQYAPELFLDELRMNSNLGTDSMVPRPRFLSDHTKMANAYVTPVLRKCSCSRRVATVYPKVIVSQRSKVPFANILHCLIGFEAFAAPLPPDAALFYATKGAFGKSAAEVVHGKMPHLNLRGHLHCRASILG